jgi:hypothetical protein
MKKTSLVGILSNWGGVSNRNVGSTQRRDSKTDICTCGKIKLKVAKNCLDCSKLKSRKVERPSKEELKKLIWEQPTLQIARQLGVSDKAIAKWCSIYDLDKPSRGYWAKKKFKASPTGIEPV